MRLNKRNIFITMLIALFVFTVFVGAALYKVSYNDVSDYESVDFDKNVLEFMKDGMKDEEIRKILKDDIELVENARETKLTQANINIRYYDVDLNEDGLGDKIIIISSGLHSGSAGDTFRILINKDGYYSSVAPFTNIELLKWDGEPFDESTASMYILENITNGHHDITIKSFNNTFNITFDGDVYQVFTNSEK